MKIALRLALVFCFCSAPFAQSVVDSCGFTPGLESRLAALDKWVQGKERERQGGSIHPQAQKPTELVNGMFVMEATPANSPHLGAGRSSWPPANKWLTRRRPASS